MFIGEIKYRFLRDTKYYETYEPAIWLPLLTRAIPWLKDTAREDAATYYNVQPDQLGQEEIKKYIIEHRSYDAVEISKIVACCKGESDGRN